MIIFSFAIYIIVLIKFHCLVEWKQNKTKKFDIEEHISIQYSHTREKMIQINRSSLLLLLIMIMIMICNVNGGGYKNQTKFAYEIDDDLTFNLDKAIKSSTYLTTNLEETLTQTDYIISYYSNTNKKPCFYYCKLINNLNIYLV